MVSSVDGAARTLTRYLEWSAAFAALLGALALVATVMPETADRWLGADEPRSMPVWFSALLWFVLGLSATAALYWEGRRGDGGERLFRIRAVWGVLALAGFSMSLHRITNLLTSIHWKGADVPFGEDGSILAHLTPGKALGAWAALIAVGLLVVFCSHRFATSRRVRRIAFTGIASLVAALFLSGVRGAVGEPTLLPALQAVLEMLGVAALAGAAALHAAATALDEPEALDVRFARTRRLVSMRAALRLALALSILFLCGTVVLLLEKTLGVGGARDGGLFATAVAQEGGEGGSARRPAAPDLWFDDLPAGIDLTPADERALARFVARGLDDQPSDLPEALAGDGKPRIAFLTIAGAGGTGRVHTGVGRGLEQALDAALASVRESGVPERESRRVKIDVVAEVGKIAAHPWSGKLAIEPGLHGLAFDRGTRTAFLPGQVLARSLVSRDLKLSVVNLRKHLSRSGSKLSRPITTVLASQRVNVFRFTTRSLYLEGDGAVRLYRDHRTFRDPDPETLLAAARRAGRYLASAVDESGRFDYAYLPRTDVSRDSYNILRHSGTTFSMFELQQRSPRPELLAAARRAVEFLAGASRPIEVDGVEHRVVVEDGFVKLGGNALGCLALAKAIEVTGDRGRQPLLVQLAGWMVAVQREDGSFGVHKQSHPGGVVSKFRSQYYPGEAILALVKTYGVDRDERWLDAAERAARYLVTGRDGDVETDKLPHDHWLLYALEELYRLRPREIYLAHARRIASAILEMQNLDPDLPDWRGSYYRPPRSTPTATRTEGLIAAYRLERDHGEEKAAARILDAIRAGVEFQLQTQLGPESSLYLANPGRADGGFRESLTAYEIRIDFVQHNLSALLGYAEILDSPDARHK